MMKRTISALALVFIASSVFASGTVTVFTQGNSEPKTLTDAERLLDLVGQPRGNELVACGGDRRRTGDRDGASAATGTSRATGGAQR